VPCSPALTGRRTRSLDRGPALEGGTRRMDRDRRAGGFCLPAQGRHYIGLRIGVGDRRFPANCSKNQRFRISALLLKGLWFSETKAWCNTQSLTQSPLTAGTSSCVVASGAAQTRILMRLNEPNLWLNSCRPDVRSKQLCEPVMPKRGRPPGHA
jgi:hypothetical protein